MALMIDIRNLEATSFYTILADKSTDRSNKEQFVVCFRWVGSRFEVYKDFVGFQNIKSKPCLLN